ncbi:fungal-specific transcription factor domain-containing protein [Ilyonectria destructans]|nr:fungal-specific transcription factor domain-containing protein [Ilyonectria destructans]
MDSSTSEPSAGGNPRPPPSRRRDKDQLSCDQCRRRKTRCDRLRPCSTCSNRGLSSKCAYPVKSRVAYIHGSPTCPRDDLKGRLAALEEQIVCLLEISHLPSGSNATAASTDDTSEAEHRTPTHRLHNTLRTTSVETGYVSYFHWTSILNNIIELKDEIQQQSGDVSSKFSSSPPRVSASPQLLYGCAPTSMENLLATIPERKVADNLVAAYFKDLDISNAFPCLHEGTFLQQYEDFWEEPSGTSVIWLGLLFGMMSMVMLFDLNTDNQHPQPRDQDTHCDGGLYATEVVQCLCLGGYADGGPHVIEALLHYLMIEHLSRPDTEAKIWLVLGTILRIALRMGYHRDPSHFPHLSPYEGEMRRRIWSFLYSSDIMLSVQVGCPKLIQEGQWDTQPPRNISDSDFNEASLELPPARSDDEPTSIQYVVARYRMVSVIGIIYQTSMNTSREACDLRGLNKLLDESYNSLQPRLRVAPNGDWFFGSAKEIFYRIILVGFLHKARIVLHWQFLVTCSPPNDPSEIENARNVCVNAALQILKNQQILESAMEPGGSLFLARIRMSSTISHEFLTATTVLSSVLCQAISSPKELEKSMKLEILATLKNSYRIWAQSSSRSREARRATELLNLVFKKVDPGNWLL